MKNFQQTGTTFFANGKSMLGTLAANIKKPIIVRLRNIKHENRQGLLADTWSMYYILPFSLFGTANA
ncbi:MAG: hypothetical protein IPO27_01975 [Bacteroidetes bacterium]|nr:hypothetical protein [Bacteroidota bacterium]